jgi:TPR repeat protein
MEVSLILERGIAAKRNGDYKRALTLYKQAQSLCPDDDRAYGNIAKLLTGTQEYEQALRYWLVVCECNRMSRAIDPMAKMVIQANAPRFFGKTLYLPGNPITEELVAATVQKNADFLDLIYRADNLSFYIGHCVIRAAPSLFVAYEIPKDCMDNLESGLLGRNIVKDLRQSDWDHVFLIAALAFCDMNLRRNMNTLSEAASFYLGDGFTPNVNITEFCAQSPIALSPIPFQQKEKTQYPRAKEDIETLTALAEAGDIDALYALGRRYQESGDGVVAPDLKKAISFFSQGAQHGHANSMYMMGIMHQTGQGVEKDNRVAAEWFRQSGESGCASAWLKLGRIFEEGWGVPKDVAFAKNCYQKAAAAGDQRGQLKLRTMG